MFLKHYWGGFFSPQGGHFNLVIHYLGICIFLWTALYALFFSCWEFTHAYVLFGCNSLARVFIQDYMSFQPRRRVTPNPANLSETKKLRREAEASKLKKKGNLKQFLFNAELIDEVKSVTEDLQTQDTDSANKTAKRTIKLTERRQKLIKLADKSEAGWLAVDEYESDELAEDSADEKRIRKAQDKAVRKKFQMAKSASGSRSTGSSIRNVPSNSQDNLLFRGL